MSLLSQALREPQKTPDHKVLCPTKPKPIDILFGGSKNVLANHIHAAVAGMSCYHQRSLPVLG